MKRTRGKKKVAKKRRVEKRADIVVHAVSLTKPIQYNMRFENHLGYKYFIVHAVLLDTTGWQIGVVAENEFGVESLVGESYWAFVESYSPGEWDVKKETARRNQIYAEIHERDSVRQ